MKPKVFHLATILIVLTVLSVACGGQTTLAPSPSPTVQSIVGPTGAPPTVSPSPTASATATVPNTATAAPSVSPTSAATAVPLNPLQIEYMRQQVYPGSDITLEQTLAPGVNYNQYVVSYKSDGLKIYALMTVPKGNKPASGWPVIIFNHGYIPPHIYRTTQRYVAYVDAIARSGYIVFKSDYRGHGSSEGTADGGGYWSPAFTVDVLNALASLKKYPDADPNRIGMWGHSMGGWITMRSAVVSKDIKAEVIWSGVIGSYTDLMYHWRHTTVGEYVPTAASQNLHDDLLKKYGTPLQNQQFWVSASPTTFLGDLSGPLQLHHDSGDSEVPVEFSQTVYDETKQAGKMAELFTYPGDDHNLTNSFNLAMKRTIAFFDQYVRNAGVGGN